MSIKIQEIEVGKEKAVIIPQKSWKKILKKLEDLDDIRAYDEAMAEDDGTRYSLDEIKKKYLKKKK